MIQAGKIWGWQHAMKGRATSSCMQTTDRSIRNLMLAIFSWIAERERENLSEWTKSGVARARIEGKYIGRPLREVNCRKVDEY